MMKEHSKWHWVCCWKPLIGMILWGVAALSLFMAWFAVWKRELVFGLEPLAWYWNALVLGVLSLGCKHGSHSCGTSMPAEKSM